MDRGVWRATVHGVTKSRAGQRTKILHTVWYGIQFFKKRCQIEKDSESGVMPGEKAQEEPGGDPQEGPHMRGLGTGQGAPRALLLPQSKTVPVPVLYLSRLSTGSLAVDAPKCLTQKSDSHLPPAKSSNGPGAVRSLWSDQRSDIRGRKKVRKQGIKKEESPFREEWHWLLQQVQNQGVCPWQPPSIPF